MELIDRKALLEKSWDADTRCGYVQVVDVGDILESPTVDPREWIYCKDQMPDVDDDLGLYDDNNHAVYTSEPVLVTFLSYHGKKPTTSDETAIYNDNDGNWYWGNEEDGLRDVCRVEVIAWMPLPKPADIRKEDEHDRRQRI